MTTTSINPLAGASHVDTIVLPGPAAGQTAASGKEQPPATDPPVAIVPAAPAPSIRDLREAMRQVVAQLEAYLHQSARDLEFSVDEASGRTVVTVRDRSTGDVVRQIPSEEALHIAQRLTAESGTFLDTLV